MYPRSVTGPAETVVRDAEKEEDRALSSIYASLYNRDYYVQMSGNNNNHRTDGNRDRRAQQKEVKNQVRI